MALSFYKLGITQYYSIPISQIEFICGNLSNIVSSVGGFVAGSLPITYHQRLNGTGYVYSASLPPLLTAAAKTGFEIIEKEPQRASKLRENIKQFREGTLAFVYLPSQTFGLSIYFCPNHLYMIGRNEGFV